jgi:hypothetical protein
MPLIIRDHTPFQNQDGKIGIPERLQSSLRFGASWYRDVEAQAPIIERMKVLFNDRFTLLRNYTLPDLDKQIPFILLGPGGLRVMVNSNESGIFEARGSHWLELNSRKETFEPADPNLIQKAETLHQAVQEFVYQHNIEIDVHRPVLLLTNSGIDVETYEPSVRIVRMDALQRYLQSIAFEEGSLSKLDINYITQIFERVARTKELERKQKPEREFNLNPFRSVNFSPFQWIILGSIFLLNIIVILVVLALLLSSG